MNHDDGGREADALAASGVECGTCEAIAWTTNDCGSVHCSACGSPPPADSYPADHDPLFAAVVSAAGWAKTRGDRDALVVLDELLDAMRDDRVGQMAALIDTHRRPVVTA